jgi:shikimate kinase
MTDVTHLQAIKAHLNRPVVLVGMPASGKTSLGRGLSHILDVPFIDIDHVIEHNIGQKIIHFFEAHGEPAFRDLETQTIRAVFADNPGACIISTGGGAVLRPDNRPLLFNNTHSFWVRANIASLLERTAKDTYRPLLKNADPEKVLLNLQSIRYPLYQQASMIVDTDGRLPEQILPEILEKINERLSTS